MKTIKQITDEVLAGGVQGNSCKEYVLAAIRADRRQIAEMVRGYYEGVNTYADPRVICRVLADAVLNKH